MNGGSIEFDTVLSLCRDRHRRIVLAVLAEEQRTLTVRDLAETILESDRGTPVTAGSGEVRTRIQRSLYHRHVPLLESAGVVEFDVERQHVAPTEQFDQLQPYLSTIVEIDPDLEVSPEL